VSEELLNRNGAAQGIAPVQETARGLWGRWLAIAKWPYRRALREWRFARTSRRNTRTSAADMEGGAPGRTIRVIWVLAGSEWLASARLKGVVVDDHFRRTKGNVFSRIAYMPDTKYLDESLTWRRRLWKPILNQGIDVVCFQTRAGATEAFLSDCRASGVATVFSVSDLNIERVPGRVWELSDAVVVSSEALAQKVGMVHPRVVMIDDMIDVPEDCAILPSSAKDQDLVLIWTGHRDRWNDVAFVNQVLGVGEFASFCLKTISNHQQATHPWTPNTAWEDARRGDIAVVPAQLTARMAAASANRLACFMAMGFPVVATPIPAYRAHIRHGENGLLATTVEEWRACLRQLRDPMVRKRLGENARNTMSVKALRIPEVAARWQQLFASLAPDRRHGE
jgi:hypothetical protein